MKQALKNAAIILFVLKITFCSADIIPMKENQDVIDQVKGEFGSLLRKESFPLGAIQKIWDKANKNAGIYCVDYRPDEIIKIRVREHMVTTIVLPVWEKIEKILVGDKCMLSITQPKDNVLALEMEDYVGADTNMTVIGKENIYWFYVRSEGYNSKNIPDVAVYIKAYACSYVKKNAIENNKQIENVEKKEKIDYLEHVPVDLTQLDFDFSMAGNEEIAPNLVYSDGIRTWLDYGEKMKTIRLPVIYSVIDGVDVPVNASRIKNKLIAQTTGPLTLKNGNKVTCVYPTKQQTKTK